MQQWTLENCSKKNIRRSSYIKTSIEKFIGKFLDYLVRMWNKEPREVQNEQQ